MSYNLIMYSVIVNNLKCKRTYQIVGLQVEEA